MLGIIRLLGALAMALLLALQPAAGAACAAAPPASVGLERDYGLMPLYFVQNQGQLDPQVAYYVQGRDKTLYFTPQGVTFALSGPAEQPSEKPFSTSSPRRYAVKLDFVGANSNVRPVGLERTEAVISYFRGSPDQWQTGLPSYGKIIYRELWPGIDLVYYGTASRLKYEFVVRPGAEPGQIRLAYRGASAVTLDDVGQLQVLTPMGSFTDEAPSAYQEGEARQRQPVTVTYAAPEEQGGAFSYGFRVGAYDRSRPLVLDPTVLVYCGFIGGAGYDAGHGIAVDGAGNAYITGSAGSSETTFPVTVGPDLIRHGDSGADAFVAKVNAAGTALLYCGYIGGTDHDVGYGIAVDDAGNAYITGETTSGEDTFPVKGGPDVTHNSIFSFPYIYPDAFVAKVSASGTALDYCGYIGGAGTDVARAIAVNGAGNAYVTGETDSSQASFPVTVGPVLTHSGGSFYRTDAFVAKVNAAGMVLDYCGYIGGPGDDYGYGIAVDSEGSAYLTGLAYWGPGFPVTVGPDLSHNGGPGDAFVAKVNTTGAAFDYCGYIGGSSTDTGYSIAVDGEGNAYVTGSTISREDTFPVMVGPDLSYNGDPSDAFVAKVNDTGTALIYCGYIGGSVGEEARGIAVDAAGDAYVTGWTQSSEASFPVTVGPDLTYSGGPYGAGDAFVARLNAAGAMLDYCGYIGGANSDFSQGIAVDQAGDAYVVGWTDSTEDSFPVVVGPDVSHNGGYEGYDAFVAKVHMSGPGSVVFQQPRIWHDPLCAGWRQRYTLVLTNTGDVPLTGVILAAEIPEKATFDAPLSSAGLIIDDAQHAHWALGTVPPGARVELYLEIRVWTSMAGKMLLTWFTVDAEEIEPVTRYAVNPVNACETPTATATATSTSTPRPTRTSTPGVTPTASVTTTPTGWRMVLPILQREFGR